MEKVSFFWFVFLDKQKNEHKKLRIYEEIAQPHLAKSIPLFDKLRVTYFFYYLSSWDSNCHPRSL